MLQKAFAKQNPDVEVIELVSLHPLCAEHPAKSIQKPVGFCSWMYQQKSYTPLSIRVFGLLNHNQNIPEFRSLQSVAPTGTTARSLNNQTIGMDMFAF